MMADNPKQPEGMQRSLERDAVQGRTTQAAGSSQGSGQGSGQDATQDLKTQARDMANQTKERGKVMLDQQRGAAAGQVDSVAHAFRAAAEQLQNEGQGTGNYVGMIAEQLESAARQLREKNLDEILHGVQDMARRSPATFIAGSVAAGFLLSRFLKSSSQHAYDRDTYRTDSYRAYRGDDDFEEDFGDRGYDRRHDRGYDRSYSAEQEFARTGTGAASSRPVEEVYDYSPEGTSFSPEAERYTGAAELPATGRTDTTLGTGRSQTTIANTPEPKPGSDNLGGSNYGNR